MIFLEGVSLAKEIQARLRERVSLHPKRLRLAIVVVGSNPVSEVFVKLKEKFAREIGIETRRYSFDESISTNALREVMADIVHEPLNDGVIVQLPLPAHIDTQSILNAVVSEKDVDMLSARSVGNFQVGRTRIIPPIVGAVRMLLMKHSIDVRGKRAVVIGAGRLVGQPIAIWLQQAGATVTIMSDPNHFDRDIIKQADIVISGAGSPHLIHGDMIKEGATVVDCGTSEHDGVTVGDVDVDSVSKRAAYVTPQKGGVGPLTVAYVFQNLVDIAEKK